MPSTRDVMGLAGLLALAAGLWMRFGPAVTLIVCGWILLILAVWSAIWGAGGGHSG